MGAIWGDPYTIGGNGDDPPSEPLESVFSPLPPAEGVPMGLGPWANPHCQDNKGAQVAAENQGFTDLRCLPPKGGPRWHPPLLGGVGL